MGEEISLTRTGITAEEFARISHLLRRSKTNATVEAFEEAAAAAFDRTCCISATSGGIAIELALMQQVLMPPRAASRSNWPWRPLESARVTKSFCPPSVPVRPQLEHKDSAPRFSRSMSTPEPSACASKMRKRPSVNAPG